MIQEMCSIALGSDHIGLPLKKIIANHLNREGWRVHDVGPETMARTDYPIYGKAAALLVQSGQCAFGILICGTGIGISITANKLVGIRCALCSDPYSAFMARSHNNANMLAFGSRVVGEGLALFMTETFLKTSYEGSRHQHRLNLITEIENQEHMQRCP